MPQEPLHWIQLEDRWITNRPVESGEALPPVPFPLPTKERIVYFAERNNSGQVVNLREYPASDFRFSVIYLPPEGGPPITIDPRDIALSFDSSVPSRLIPKALSQHA